MTRTARTVIVTGGASGIGAEIVEQFIAAGDDVVIADRDLRAAQKRAADHRTAVARRVDVTVPEEIDALIDGVVQDSGGLDVLVNCAGAAHAPLSAPDMGVAAFDAEFALNLRAAYLASRRAVEVMGEGSVIVNIASMGGRRPRPLTAAYNAAKGGTIAFVRELARVASPRVRVYAVNPTGVETPFLLKALGPEGLTDEHRARVVAGIPMARLATPADVANVVRYLADSHCGVRSGEFIDVDGGRSIQ
ncbi:MAG: SDR family oxidoreductase [Aeromicrobium sp.]